MKPAAILPIWEGPAPGFENASQLEKESWFPNGACTVTRNVTVPTLSVYLPSSERAVGTGVIVAPGGGFRFLSMGAEGHDVAWWLAERGIAAFVLKYRLVETPADDREMWHKAAKMVADPAWRPDFTDDALPGIADGIKAMELVRARVAEWAISSDRIGFLGFSAGAMVACQVALEANDTRRPNFVAAIYGAPFGNIPSVPTKMPPVFLAYSSDDVLATDRVPPFYSALLKAGQHPELHVYHNGGHGYGLNPQGLSSDHWIEDCYNWVRSLGLAESKRAI
jgi:acetyl esterase/lipase